MINYVAFILSEAKAFSCNNSIINPLLAFKFNCFMALDINNINNCVAFEPI